MTDSTVVSHDFQLGQRVQYKRTLFRTWRDGRKFWESYAWGDGFPSNPNHNGEGIVTGLRRLSNGPVRYLGEDGSQYEPDEFFMAVVITHHLRRKPVLVLPENVQVLS